MGTGERHPGPTMDGPTVYRVRVRGRLGAEWSDRLEGMDITSESTGGSEESILVGRLQDQSALSGVLNTLYELHLPVISVTCLESE